MNKKEQTEEELKRTATLSAVKNMLWKIYELEVTVKDCEPGSQQVVEERMASFLNTVKEVSSNTWAYKELKIPVDLLTYLDNGGNPDQYTVDTFKSCMRDNQAVKGRVLAVQAFQDELTKELDKKMPEESKEYKELLLSSAAHGNS